MGEYSKLQRAEEADAAATKCPDKFRPNLFEQQVCHRPLTPVDLTDCTRHDTTKRLSRPIYDFMMEVFEAMNASDLSVALKIEGTSRCGRGTSPPAPEMQYNYDSQDVWTRKNRWNGTGYSRDVGHYGFERMCRHDNPEKSEDRLQIYIKEWHGQQYLWLQVVSEYEKWWILSIETFAVTPIRKDAQSSIGQCHLPRSDEQGVFNMNSF